MSLFGFGTFVSILILIFGLIFIIIGLLLLGLMLKLFEFIFIGITWLIKPVFKVLLFIIAIILILSMIL